MFRSLEADRMSGAVTESAIGPKLSFIKTRNKINTDLSGQWLWRNWYGGWIRNQSSTASIWLKWSFLSPKTKINEK